MKKIQILIASLLISVGSIAQDPSQNESKIIAVNSKKIKDTTTVVTSISEITNRLGRTKSARAIPKGKMLTSVGYSYLESNDGYREHRRSAPNFSLGYGLTKWMDISFEATYSFNETEELGYWNPITYSKNGIDFVKIGTKFNVIKQKGWAPQLAIYVGVVGFGYSKIRDYQDHFDSENGFVLNIPWAYQLGDKFRLSGSFGYIYTDWIPNLAYSGSINGRYEFGNGMGVFLDLFVPTTNFNYASFSGTTGVFYRINSSMQFDLSYRKSYSVVWNNYTYDMNKLSIGFSWLMFNK